MTRPLTRRTPRWPRSIDLELTNRCNLRCGNCWFYGTAGIGDRYSSSELDTATILDFIDQLPRRGPSIYFGGGEPLLRSDLPSIVAHAAGRGLPTALTTNGTLLTAELGRQLLDASLRRMHVSIDGPEELHDCLRGPGTYRSALENLRSFLAERTAARRRYPRVTVKLTVNPELVGRVEETMAELRKATDDGVDSYQLHHLWFVTPQELEQHRSQVQLHLGCSANGAASHLLGHGADIDTQTLATEVGQLRGTRRVRFYPNLRAKELADYYAEMIPSSLGCRSAWNKILVKPNGDVRFCPDEWIDDYHLGSILENSLHDIWTGEPAERFRQVIDSQRSFMGCKRCSWLR